MSDIEKVKKLREATGAGFKDCNLAVKESGGDLDKAVEILRVKGISKASKLGIPICAILDSNSNPDGIDFPIPGNDDARRAIDLYCNLVKETIENAKKASPSKTQEKPEVEDVNVNEKSTKTVQELDREKLDAKFSKKEKEKLN